MTTPNTFLVVEGILYERMAFMLMRGYETVRIPVEYHVQESTGPFVAELWGEGDLLLNRTPLDVRFSQGCCEEASPSAGLVRAALPYHPVARRFVLRAYDQEIFSAPVGGQAPEIRGVKVKRQKERVLVQFDFGTTNPEHVELFLELRSGRRFPLDAACKGGKCQVDLSSYAGLEAGRIRVRVSQELRSSEAWSDFVELPKPSFTGASSHPARETSGPPGTRAVSWRTSPTRTGGASSGTKTRRAGWSMARRSPTRAPSCGATR